MNSKVFISWGGDFSKKLAHVINNWLPSVLQFVKPYFSPEDIEKGSRWESNIAKELEASNIGLICLTPDNITRPWILFEAGALSKNFGHSKVCTLLFNIDNTSQIEGPLANFQSTKFEKEDFFKLIKLINSTGEDSQLNPETLKSVFDMWWPKLEEEINDIIKNHKEQDSPQRSTEDLLEEILARVRLLNFNSTRIPGDVVRENLINLISLLKTIKNYSGEFPMENDLFYSVKELCKSLGYIKLWYRLMPPIEPLSKEE